MIRYGLLLLAAMATGCGYFDVRVSALNPRVVEAEENRQLVRESLPLVLAQTDVGVKTEIGKLRDIHFAEYQKIWQSYLDAADKPENAEFKTALQDEARRLQSDFATFIGSEYTRAIDKVIQLNHEIQELVSKARAAAKNKRTEEERKLVSAYTARLRERRDTLFWLYQAIIADLGTRLTAEKRKQLQMEEHSAEVVAAKAEAAAKSVKADVDNAMTRLIKRVGLSASPFLYAVVSAKEDDWSSSNSVYSSGQWGNIDVAVKLVPPDDESGLPAGDYTLKGLTFDPGDVAVAAAKVTTQSVLLAAQIAGVPVRFKGTPTGSGAALAKSSQRLADANVEAAMTRARMDGFRDALNTVARRIVEQAENLNKDDASRAEAVKAIKAAYDANKQRINLKEEDS